MLSRLSRLRALVTLVLATAPLLAAPAAANAATRFVHHKPIPLNRALFLTPGSPLASVAGMSSVPYHFDVSAGAAVLLAEHTRTMQQLHRRMHPLHVEPFVWRSTSPFWYVTFTYHGKLVAAADIGRDGKLLGVWTGLQAGEPYTHGDLAGVLSAWWILVPSSLLFMLAFIDPRRLRRIAVLDGLAVVSFLASYVVLAQGHLESSVWLAYPPMIYLLVRLLRLGFGARQSTGRIAPLLSTPLLTVGLPLLLAGRIVASLLGHQEIDIGYESVTGAFRILHHLPIYWNDPNHGDTYGPVTYLAYVPFELIFPWKNLNSVDAANYASIFFDLATAGCLVLLGRRLRAGAEGLRIGLVLAWAWAACPFTVIGVIVHTNDALITTLGLLALLAITSPAISGALIGLAAAAKFSPVGLLPLIAAPRQRGRRGALVCVGAFTLVFVAAIYSWLPPGGLSFLWQRTIEFQMTRPDVFSPWGLHPALHPVQILLEVFALGLMAAVAFFPRERPMVAICALAGALMIAIQLPASHWFYYYILWFLPFALVALLVPRSPADAMPESERAGADTSHLEVSQEEPVLAGV